MSLSRFKEIKKWILPTVGERHNSGTACETRNNAVTIVGKYTALEVA